MPEIIIKLGDQIVQKYYLYKDQISIGRAPENEIAIENLAVSRRHAEISKDNGSYVLEDLNSANGTFVNGVQVTRTEIVDKDVISIGKHKLYFYNQQVGAMQMVEKTMLVTRPAQTKAMLRVTRGKQKDQIFELSKVENKIGRAADNEVRLGDWFVSKHHAEIVRKGMVYVVRDLASWRHTMVNGQIVDEQVLKPGDEIQFGPKIAMVFEVADGTAAREGTGRKPVELEGFDQPLPIAGADPGTPLPIAGAGRLSKPAIEPFPEPNAHSAHQQPHQNGAGADPQLDEVWDEEFEPGEFGSEEDSQASGRDVDDYDDESDGGYSSEAEESNSVAAAELNVAPIRLEDEDLEAAGGWDEAASRASAEESNAFEAHSVRAGASDSWSPDAVEAVRLDGEDGDAVAEDSGDQVEWIDGLDASVELDSRTDEPSEAVERADEDVVATLDSGGIESPAAQDGAEQEQAAVGVGELGDESPERQAGLRVEDESTAVLKGAALVDSIMDTFGPERGLARSEVEMWVGALGNPSRIIRKQAQRQLQKLTGQVYDIEP